MVNVGAFLAPGQECPLLFLVSLAFFAIPHRRKVPTPSSAHAYKAKGGGTFLRSGTAKKNKKLQRTPLIGLKLKMLPQ